MKKVEETIEIREMKARKATRKRNKKAFKRIRNRKK